MHDNLQFAINLQICNLLQYAPLDRDLDRFPGRTSDLDMYAHASLKLRMIRKSCMRMASRSRAIERSRSRDVRVQSIASERTSTARARTRAPAPGAGDTRKRTFARGTSLEIYVNCSVNLRQASAHWLTSHPGPRSGAQTDQPYTTRPITRPPPNVTPPYRYARAGPAVTSLLSTPSLPSLLS